MSNDQPIVVTVTHHYTASPERVFDAWLDPAKAKRFLFATDTGEMVRADIDPKVGGQLTFVDRRDGEDVAHVGTYQVIDRPRTLVFSFSVPKYSADISTVQVKIEPDGEGSKLTLTHELKPDQGEIRDRDEKGWTMILANLEKAL